MSPPAVGRHRSSVLVHRMSHRLGQGTICYRSGDLFRHYHRTGMLPIRVSFILILGFGHVLISNLKYIFPLHIVEEVLDIYSVNILLFWDNNST